MEYLDVYDDNGELTGKRLIRWVDKLGEHEHFASIHVLLHNKEGRFLIQRRALNKKTRPGTWDITCGAVTAGEDAFTSALREVEEEDGIRLEKDDIKYIGRVMSNTGVFQHIYIAEHDFSLDDCSMQEEEVCELKLISPAEMIDFADTLQHRTEEYRNYVKSAVREKFNI
jgi:isopentenyldiphosphate isomerase